MKSEKTSTIEGIKTYTLYETPNNGSEDAPLVLLCHALMANHHMYDSTVKALHSAGYRTLRYDHIGHNNSPAPPAPSADFTAREDLVTSVDFDLLTRHMRSLVQIMTGQSSLHAVIGCSMGGVLALRYAQLHPKEVSHIISIGAPGIKAIESAKPLWSERIKILESDVANGTDELCRKTVERWLPGDEERSVRARAMAYEQTRSCSLRGYAVCADAIRDYDYEEGLGAIEAKTMVMNGSRDTACGPRENNEGVAKKIPRGVFVWLEGAGHLPPLHLAEQFEGSMLRFLRT